MRLQAVIIEVGTRVPKEETSSISQPPFKNLSRCLLPSSHPLIYIILQLRRVHSCKIKNAVRAGQPLPFPADIRNIGPKVPDKHLEDCN